MKKIALVCVALLMSGIIYQKYNAKIVVFPVRYDQGESIHGLRASSSPYISGDTFREVCDFIIDEKCIPFNTEDLKEGDVIFMKSEFLSFFFSKVHPLLTKHYILVSHNSDAPAPGRFAHYLEDEKLIAWFGQNCDINYHPKFFPIPIGLANRYWPHGNIAVFDEIRATLPSQKRDIFLYLNFTNSSHPERVKVDQVFAHADFCYRSPRKSHRDYLRDLTRTTFVLSPQGNGLDCMRPWEALLMGAIPVMRKTTLDPLFEGLPVVLVDDWNEVTQEFLQAKYTEMQTQTFAHERMFAPYWLEKIETVKRAAKAYYGTQG